MVSGDEKSLLSLIVDSDIVVQLVMLILLAASIWSWAIIIYKWLALSDAIKRTSHFEKIFSRANLEKIFEHFKDSPSSPIEHVFVAALNKKHKSSSCSNEEMSAVILSTKNRCVGALEDGLSSLATIAASTPFIGLFGTVWGIMHSFQSIASSKNTSLAVVAPGIAEALLATGLGLAAAIPALIFYNLLNARIQKIESSLDSFSIELYVMIGNLNQKD